jgi:basic membrane protein A
MTTRGTCRFAPRPGSAALSLRSPVPISEGVLSQVRARSTRRAIAAIGVAGLLVAAAGCGSDDNSSSSSSSDTATTAAAPAKKAIKVGLVTDIGGLNDRSFNTLANQGLEQAKSQLGITGRVLTSKSNADYIPNLSTLAQQKYDLVIGVGFLMADAIDTVAKKFPDTKFAIIDVDAVSLKGAPKNVEGLLFKEQESGYLAGTLAGLYAKDNNITTISSVGGQKIPPVDHYIAGYEAGAKAANPSIKTLHAYSQDFVDQAKCKEIALSQIARGSGVVFQVAGQCGLGALDAAKSKGKQGIGVDADQAYLGDYILTSAIKKVDTSVLDTVKQVQDDKYTGGADTTFDVKNGGAGIGKVSAAGTKYQTQLDDVTTKLKAGSITVPDTVK